MSTGFVLNIPQEMLNRLEDADKKIEKLAKTSEDAQTRIVSAMYRRLFMRTDMTAAW